MKGWIITAICNACRDTAPVNELIQHDNGYDCPRCSKPFYYEPEEMVDRACDDCGRIIRWPADDDLSRGVLCHPCIRALVAAS